MAGSSSSGYDHRWLLFLIPLILFFLLLIFATWFLLRRRNKQKRRRSVLRNRTVVIAEKERQREREERRLSRGNSLSSKLSRMTSTRSTATKNNSQRGKNPSRYAKGDGHSRFASSSTQSHSTEMGGRGTRTENRIEDDEKDAADIKDASDIEQVNGLDRIQLVDGEVPEVDHDLEREAESEAAITGTAASSGNRVRIVEDERPPSRPTMASRKELSVIGETGVGEEVMMAEENNEGKVVRQSSVQSNQGRPSSNSLNTPSSSNPFASPVEGSFVESPNTAITPTSASTTEEKGSHNVESTSNAAAPSAVAGLGRKLSGVIRLRQPSPTTQRARSPASPSPHLHRSDSRASRKSSTKSFSRVESPVTSLAGQGSGNLPISGSWTYTPKAAQWKSSSTDVTSTSAATPDTSIDPPIVRVQDVSSTEGEGDEQNKEILSNDEIKSSDHLSPSSSGVQLARKNSTGVAGSRFVESFDD